MKKIIFIRLSLFLFSIFIIVGCSESKIHEFSHDEDLNSWVLENKEELSNYERKQIKLFSQAKQKAILRVLTPQKRQKIWASKVQHLLSLEMSNEEKMLLKWFAEIFKKIDYDKPTPQLISNQMYNKALKAKKVFGWSDEFIHNLFFTVSDINLNISMGSDITTEDEGNDGGVGGPPDTCDCKYDFGCGLIKECASNKTCKYNTNDCGFFGNDACNGTCT